MQRGNYRHMSHAFSKQFPRTESYDERKHSQYKPVRLNRKRGVPCCFCEQRVKCENMKDHNRDKLVSGRNLKRVSYPKAVVQSKELFVQKERLNLAPMRTPELPYRSSAENVASDNRRKKGKNRSEDMTDDVVESIVKWEALLPDGWQAYTPKISNSIEKVYRRVRSLDLEDSDEKKCWQEESYYYQFKQYRISPHFMLQRNMNTGKDRKIRRKKVQLSSKAKFVRPMRKMRTGSKGNSNPPPKVWSEQKHSPPEPPLKQHVMKRRKKSGKQRHVESDWKHDFPEKDDIHYDGNTDDTNLILNFKNYKKWDTAHVITWLRILNYPQYCRLVSEKAITGKELSSMTMTYLVAELMMSVEHATHIFCALERIKSGFNEHGDDSSQFSSLSGQENTSFSREMKHQKHDKIVDESGRDSMILMRKNDVDGIVIGGGFSGPPIDLNKTTPTSEGNSVYSVNDSEITDEEQGSRLYMCSVNLDMKSNHAYQVHHTSIMAEQKESKSSFVDETLFPKDTSLLGVEKESDIARRIKVLKMNVDISKQADLCGSLTKDCKDTEVQVIGKDQSLTSGNMSHKINFRSESLTYGNASHKKPEMLLSKGYSGVKEVTTNVDLPKVKNNYEALHGNHQESLKNGSQHPEAAETREQLMSLQLNHVDDIDIDYKENGKAHKTEQTVIDITSYEKHLQEIGLSYLDSTSFVPIETSDGSPIIVKKESPGNSSSSVLGHNESQSTSPSLIVWQGR